MTDSEIEFEGKYRVVKYEDRIELIPIDDDPLQAIRDAAGDAFKGKSITELREEALELAKQEAEDDLPDDRKAALAAQWRASSESTKDDYHGEGHGELRETVIRYDPENVTWEETREHLQRIDEAETEEEIRSIPKRRVFGVANEEDYERISEAVYAVAQAFSGMDD